MKRAIKTHISDFAAILVLLVLSVAVAGYVLSHERLRFPFIESSPFTMNAEFSTAQAVTPGQGQTVRVSGVQIGEIGGVTLKNGIAIVSMNIDQKYKRLIHTDAYALLRPRTGLKDMFVELNPGSTHAPIAKPGFTISGQQHAAGHQPRRGPLLARRRHARISRPARQRRRSGAQAERRQPARPGARAL